MEKLKDANQIIKEVTEVINFVPNNLRWLTETETIFFDNEHLKTSILLDIIHSIRVKYNIYDKKDSEDGFALNGSILMKNYGNHYAKYMKFLLDGSDLNRVQILRNTKPHMAGKRSKMFALNNYYLEENYFYFKNSNKKAVNRKKKQLQDLLLDKDYSPIPLDIRNRLYNDITKFYIEEFDAIHTLDVLRENGEITKHKRDSNIQTVQMIVNGVIEFSADKHGRLHTIFTRLKREIRKNNLKVLTENGLEETVEFDIPNSQPTMFLFILRDFLSEIDMDDYIKYRITCKTGNFYQLIIDYYKSGGKNITRKDAKGIIYTYLFGPVIKLTGKRKAKESRRIIRTAFIKIFGKSIDNWLTNYKNNHPDKYNAFSWLLQNYESKIIFDTIIREIKEVDPNIPIITVHDSIIVPKSKKDIVFKIFNKHMDQIFEDVDIELEYA